MQGTYENVKIIGIFCRYGIQQSVDNNGTFYYRPIVYMRNCKNLNNIDLKLPEYLLFNLTCLLYTSPSPRDPKTSRMPSSA